MHCGHVREENMDKERKVRVEAARATQELEEWVCCYSDCFTPSPSWSGWTGLASLLWEPFTFAQ